MTIPFSRSLILWISVQSRKLRLRQTPDIFGRLRTSSEDFELLRKTSDFFGNLRKWSCRLQKSQHSQDKNLTLISQKKLAGIFYGENTPIPTQSLRRIFKLILQEFAFGFNGKNYLQTHGTAMGTKMAVAFANIFMSVVETEILNFSKLKLNLLSGKDTLTIFSHCEELRERRWMNLLLLQTGITLQLNLRLNCLIKRLTFWIQLFTKARDFTTKESLTLPCEQRPFDLPR